MKPLNLDEAERMRLANILADAAQCLDDIRSLSTSTADMLRELSAAPQHVEALQAVAFRLAGERAGEIFHEDESADVAVCLPAARGWLDDILSTCPFCGSLPSVQFAGGGSGGGPGCDAQPLTGGKNLIACENEACDVKPVVATETAADAIHHWNHRADQARKVC